MLPSHIITSCVLANLDIGHQFGRRHEVPVGAATFTARAEHGEVNFTLDTFVLKPADPPGDLLGWLDRKLIEPGTTLAGYQLPRAATLLARLPGGSWSSAVRELTGGGRHEVLDLSARQERGRLVTFQEACEVSRIACAPLDPAKRFAAWCANDTNGIARDLEVDGIATLRLILRRIADRTLLGRKVAAAMNAQLTVWLQDTATPAARIHRTDLGKVAG